MKKFIMILALALTLIASSMYIPNDYIESYVLSKLSRKDVTITIKYNHQYDGTAAGFIFTADDSKCLGYWKYDGVNKFIILNKTYYLGQ